MIPDPGLTFKYVFHSVYDQGYTVKHNDLAVYEAALVASPGYPFPEPPPLPPPVCTPPFSACSFGSPSNTAAELANIAAWLAVADSFVALDPADPTTVATFLGGFLEPVSGTRRSGFLTAQPSGYWRPAAPSSTSTSPPQTQSVSSRRRVPLRLASTR